MTSRAAAVKDGRRSPDPRMSLPPGHALTAASTMSSWLGRTIGKEPETQAPFNGCYGLQMLRKQLLQANSQLVEENQFQTRQHACSFLNTTE